MPRSRWSILIAAAMIVVVWVLAFRDGLDPLSVLAAVIASMGAVLLGQDGLQGGRGDR